MAEQSPIVPADLGPITSGTLACDHLRELLATRSKVQTLLTWLLQDDASGDLGDDFLLALSHQFLFDATKKNWFVGTDPTTGYLALFQYVSLAGLDPAGAVEGDTITFDATAGRWQIVSAPYIYAAPTTGGPTPPAASSGGEVSVAHGFSAAPKVFAAYLECISTDAGYVVGDRIDTRSLSRYNNASSKQYPACTLFSNATTVGLIFHNGSVSDIYQVNNKSSFAIGTLNPANWNVKLYAAR